MERRWPLGIALLLLLCAPLPPGARAEEGTDPRPLPFPADGQQPTRASIPKEALFPPRPTTSPWLVPSSGEIDWPGQSLVFNPRLLPTGSVTPTLLASPICYGWRGSS